MKWLLIAFEGADRIRNTEELQFIKAEGNSPEPLQTTESRTPSRQKSVAVGGRKCVTLCPAISEFMRHEIR